MCRVGEPTSLENKRPMCFKRFKSWTRDVCWEVDTRLLIERPRLSAKTLVLLLFKTLLLFRAHKFCNRFFNYSFGYFLKTSYA